jgi:hypothetical protein
MNETEFDATTDVELTEAELNAARQSVGGGLTVDLFLLVPETIPEIAEKTGQQGPRLTDEEAEMLATAARIVRARKSGESTLS